MEEQSFAPAPPQNPQEPRTPKVPRMVFLAGGIVVIIAVGIGVVMLIQKKQGETRAPSSEITSPAAASPARGLPTFPSDSDGDRLPNDEEVALGTNPFHPDTDGDELFDAAEVRIYKTDPKNPDSDGDGFKDGAEVRAGYNPAGAGKL